MIEFYENFDFAQNIYTEINDIINELIFFFNKNKHEINVINRDRNEAEYKSIWI